MWPWANPLPFLSFSLHYLYNKKNNTYLQSGIRIRDHLGKASGGWSMLGVQEMDDILSWSSPQPLQEWMKQPKSWWQYQSVGISRSSKISYKSWNSELRQYVLEEMVYVLEADRSGFKSWWKGAEPCAPPTLVQRPLRVPCLLFVEKLKSLRLPWVTKEQVQAVKDEDNRVIDSVSDAHPWLVLQIL